MTETNDNVAQTDELADMRPPQGEYIYIEDGVITSHYDPPTHPTCFACFVCEKKVNSSHGFVSVYATAQCMAAGRRIAAMFKPDACHGPYESYRSRTSAGVDVLACDRHIRNAEILCRLTADGIITLERISLAMNSAISRQEFNERAANEAGSIWERREKQRGHENWCDAWQLCLKELGHVPSLSQHRERAHQLWLERKDSQAVADWLEAEKKVAALYTVAA